MLNLAKNSLMKVPNRKVFSWNNDDDPEDLPDKTDQSDKTKKKRKLFKSSEDSTIAKKKDTEVPLMPIPATELPIIPKFIHVQNSYIVNEDTYSELIELIRAKKNKKCCCFPKNLSKQRR